MSQVVVRISYRVPAAAPEPCNRWRVAWGFKALHRLMRAIPNAARMLKSAGSVTTRAICDGAVFPAGRTVGAVPLYGYENRTCKAVRLNFRRLYVAAGRLISSLVKCFQQPTSGSANQSPGVSVAVAQHAEQQTTGHRACQTRSGAEMHPNGASL